MRYALWCADIRRHCERKPSAARASMCGNPDQHAAPVGALKIFCGAAHPISLDCFACFLAPLDAARKDVSLFFITLAQLPTAYSHNFILNFKVYYLFSKAPSV